MSSKVLEDKYFKIQIKTDTWNIYLVPESDNDIVDEGSRAETVFSDKEMYYKETNINTVRHELIHVYMHYTYTDTAELTALQNEEVMCEMLSYEWDNVDQSVKEIHKGLEKLKKSV